MESVNAVARGWTGYTHAWKANPQLSRILMASTDTEMETHQAKLAGWRTFRVRKESAPLMSAEIQCPASEEMGHRTTCGECRLCNGTTDGDKRKDITIIAHGSGKRNLKSDTLVQIGGIAA